MANGLQFIDALVEDVITKVNQQHKSDERSRIKIYKVIGEKFTGLARVLSCPNDSGGLEHD